MGPVLTELIALQSIENRLRAVKNLLSRCRRRVTFQENQIRTLASGLETKKEQILLTRMQCDRLELELKTTDDEVAKYRAVLNTAKTNKEYASILMTLNTTKADNSKIEAQALELMKTIEADQAECVEIGKEIETQKLRLEEIRKETAVSATGFENEIAEIEEKWGKIAAAVPGDFLEVFKRVADTYDGEALALVEQQDERREAYSCGGCFMGIPIETVNMLMTKDEISRCPSCTRILVLKPTES